MRQGGMKPKSHTSGTYWVRAQAKTGRKGNTEIDPNRDKWTDGNPANIISTKQKFIAFNICFWGLLAFIAFSFIFF